MIGSFYNTINLSGRALATARCTVVRQEMRVLMFFIANRGKGFTGYEIMDMVFPRENVPRHSISRAFTNLTDQGLLEKTKQSKMERMGKPNYKWRLVAWPTKVLMDFVDGMDWW
jgi:predicted transcriptional regulator